MQGYLRIQLQHVKNKQRNREHTFEMSWFYDIIYIELPVIILESPKLIAI